MTIEELWTESLTQYILSDIEPATLTVSYSSECAESQYNKNIYFCLTHKEEVKEALKDLSDEDKELILTHCKGKRISVILWCGKVFRERSELSLHQKIAFMTAEELIADVLAKDTLQDHPKLSESYHMLQSIQYLEVRHGYSRLLEHFFKVYNNIPDMAESSIFNQPIITDSAIFNLRQHIEEVILRVIRDKGDSHTTLLEHVLAGISENIT